MTTQTYGTYTPLTVVALQSLASSATAGWQSDVIDNRTAGAIDYEFLIRLPMANTAPANDRAIYVFAVPAVYDTVNSTWRFADGGTTTLPSGTQGIYSIAGVAATNNLYPLLKLNYTTQNQTVQGWATLSNVLGQTMPDGWVLVIVNYSGAALSTGCIVAYRAIT